MNTLIIGDLHSPFILDGYLEFCKEIQARYNCKRVIFIGDIIDNHYSSYHESDPDGFGGYEELMKSRKQLKQWYKAFPEAYVCLGNHDIIPNRKAFSNGLSKRWIKDISEVINSPVGWQFAEHWVFDGVLYCHGTGRKAKNRAIQDLTSVVQGHYHSEGYVQWYVGMTQKFFAMQVGCGINRKAYAFAYGKMFAKPHISCGVVINNGETAILEYMDLQNKRKYKRRG